MNVNGSRFHLILGEADWGRCLVGDGVNEPQQLSEQETLLIWDATRKELCLPIKPITLGATPGEKPVPLEARRAATADRYGNIYWIDTDPTQLRVWSVGSDRESAFWSDDLVSCDTTDSDFQTVTTTEKIQRKFTALAVTKDHYLVVTFTTESVAGLLAFDLIAGGSPVETLWSTSIPFAPFDMVARHSGGVWILDREHTRLWELDCRLTVISSAQDSTTLTPAEAAIFQPVNGENAAKPQSATIFPAGIDLNTVIGENFDPIAVELLQDGSVLLLDLNETAGKSRIFRLHRLENKITSDEPVSLKELAHDFVVAKTLSRTAPTSELQLLVATASGNQALAYDIYMDADKFELRPSSILYPLRRYAGRAVFKGKDNTASYDSGMETFRWVPIVQQPRVCYDESIELITPVFDGIEPQCVWDRLMLDASIPADAFVEVSCRVADELPMSHLNKESIPEIIGSWQVQPKPYLRSDGAELPWLRDEAARSTQREKGIGTWELLLQNMRGRYLQIKLRISGNGMVTPRLRALRVWYPRFSYSQRFLPAVYREDPIAGDFIDRFLANMEGINTSIEDRIKQAQALFDPRCAPDATLEWLAGWFDVALDPKWEEWRSRLFIKHAMDFFRWRGTVHGLRLALSLAFANCQTALSFDDPNPDQAHLHSIRIVEAYLTRKVGAAVAGDPESEDSSGFRTIKLESLWSPKEDNDVLLERYARFLGQPMTFKPFDLAPPSDASLQERWRQFCEQHFGFIPSIGALDRQNWQRYLAINSADTDLQAAYPSDWSTDSTVAEKWRAYSAIPNATRTRWQDFLARRYRRIAKLNKEYQTAWPTFDLVALPDYLPATEAARTDWLQFEKNLLAIVRTAHRFSVLLPVSVVTEDPAMMERQIQLARRIIELEKPAHTVFDVRFYWALNRIGEARLGLDTLLDQGSRAHQLIPDAVLGQAYLGASFVGGAKPLTDSDRYLLKC